MLGQVSSGYMRLGQIRSG